MFISNILKHFVSDQKKGKVLLGGGFPLFLVQEYLDYDQEGVKFPLWQRGTLQANEMSA